MTDNKCYTREFFFNIFDTCVQNDSVLTVQKNSLKICNIEYANTYQNYYSYTILSQAMNNIHDGKSVFYKKDCLLDRKLRTKYNFLIKCSHILLCIANFIEQLDFATKDIYIFIFQYVVQLFEKY